MVGRDLPRTARPTRGRFPPALVAGFAGQLLLLGVLSVATGLGPVGRLAGSAYAVAVVAVLTAALRRHGPLGPADHVTLARATLTGCVTALVADTVRAPAPAALLATISTVALILDAVDGRVARRTRSATPLGARFDMEVDAFHILVLSGYAAESLGAWTLAIGAMRYAFVAAGRPLPWLRSPLPQRMTRKAVAALQGIVLTVVAGHVLPHPGEVAATAAALAALVWSFARDIRWLHRHRSGRPGSRRPHPAP